MSKASHIVRMYITLVYSNIPKELKCAINFFIAEVFRIIKSSFKLQFLTLSWQLDYKLL